MQPTEPEYRSKDAQEALNRYREWKWIEKYYPLLAIRYKILIVAVEVDLSTINMD